MDYKDKGMSIFDTKEYKERWAMYQSALDANMLDRHYIGFEKDEACWRKSIDRIKNEQQQFNLF